MNFASPRNMLLNALFIGTVIGMIFAVLVMTKEALHEQHQPRPFLVVAPDGTVIR